MPKRVVWHNCGICPFPGLPTGVYNYNLRLSLLPFSLWLLIPFFPSSRPIRQTNNNDQMLSDLLVLIIGYVLFTICFIIIFARLSGAYCYLKTWALDDYWMVCALAALVGRVVAIHLVLVNGTNNVSDPGNLSDEERRRREFGSKMVFIGRTCYALL